MAIMPKIIENGRIVEIINSEEFNTLKQRIMSSLGIQNREVPITTENYAHFEDGHVSDNTNARIIFNRDIDTVNRIEFYIESLKRTIENKLFRIHNDEVFNRAAEMFIEFALIHELVHLMQFENENIDREIIMNNSPNSEIETEANDRASEILREYGTFESAIVDIILGDDSIHNSNRENIENLYR